MIHPFSFDPTYGYNLEKLLEVRTPACPSDFAEFWIQKYNRTMSVLPTFEMKFTGIVEGGWQIFDIAYQSTDDVRIGGWILIPNGPIRRGFVVLHGYGGRDGPDLHLPFQDAVLFFPCCRGISRSPNSPISSEPEWHVLHDIDKPHRYIHGGCVEDLWIAVSIMLQLYPFLSGHLGFLGISFGAGIGAMAIPWDQRINKAHFNVPAFGNRRLGLSFPTMGSADSVQRFYKKYGEVTFNTLKYYDAACSATFIKIPVHCALAAFDPYVAPPGQFSIYNSLKSEKQLFVFDAGHFSYPLEHPQHAQLLVELEQFFEAL